MGEIQKFTLAPRGIEEAMRYAEVIANSEIIPNEYRNKPANVLVAIQMGMELGLPPLQALQNIAVINGRPAVWGDSLLALARAHPAFEWIKETFDDATMTAVCTIKRKGEPEQTRTFSQADAQAAGLWGKNTWKAYPKRMLQMRARSWAIRDVFPDALRGLSVAEEVVDAPTESAKTDGEVIDIQAEPRPQAIEELPEYPAERMEANIEKWRAMIQNGKTAEHIISTIQSRFRLTEDQQAVIKALEVEEAEVEEISQAIEAEAAPVQQEADMFAEPQEA